MRKKYKVCDIGYHRNIMKHGFVNFKPYRNIQQQIEQRPAEST